MSLAAFIKDRARALGFDAAGITSADDLAATEEVLLQRIDGGLMAGLSWFTPARARLACRPQELLPGARSIVALAASYNAVEPPLEETGAPRGRVARYAWGSDYHEVLRERLWHLVEEIGRELGYSPGARTFVDSSPLVDREVARRAGVGWVGKNTNVLIRGLGSWAFLAAIILDVPLPEDPPLLTHCGSCDLCIRACPTGALLTPYTLDNARCIAYQTIENRGVIPQELRPLMGDWVFGCDICQEVCPVNRKAARSRWEEFQARGPETARPDLVALLEMDTPTYQARYRGSPLKRARRTGLQRNAAVALGNAGDPAARPALERALETPDAPVRGHAAWALGRIGGREARQALEAARRTEQDPDVREEMHEALAKLP
ncbi:MAG: tRNA epoxyqueuosine(34) reductase QueG [Chloroflexi bacterium]|nr:tRNA epoxyqueuosine(34) reductase QueG [Chloroflexota bacterium]